MGHHPELYIEEDNLEVLKILQESYLGAVKVIYLTRPTTFATISSIQILCDGPRRISRCQRIPGRGGKINFQRKNSFGRQVSPDWCSMLFSDCCCPACSPRRRHLISIDDHESSEPEEDLRRGVRRKQLLNQFAWVSISRAARYPAEARPKPEGPSRLPGMTRAASLSYIHFRQEDARCVQGLSQGRSDRPAGPLCGRRSLYNHNRKFNEGTRPNLVFSIFYQPHRRSPRAIGEAAGGSSCPHAMGTAAHKHCLRWSQQKIADEP